MIDSQKRTIVYIGGELPDKTAGAHRILSNGKALLDYGYNVVFISDSRFITNQYDHQADFQGFDIWFIRYPKTLISWLKRLFSAKTIIDLLANYKNIDAIVIYDPSVFPLLQLKHYCDREKIVLISDCAEWHTTTHLSILKRVVKFLDINLVIRYAQKRIDGIIVMSSFWSKIYDSYNVLKLIPLIDKDDPKWRLTSISQRVPPGLRFVYAGNMGKEKDRVDNIVSAFSRNMHLNFVLDVIGITKETFSHNFPELSGVVNSNPEKFRFRGYLSHLETLEFIKQADFSFLIRENTRKNNAGFPTKFGESVACGTPVIASVFSDVKDYINKYSLGILIDGTDCQNITKGIKNAFSLNEIEIKEMKKNCHSCNVFDYRTHISMLGKFVSETIERKKNNEN